MIRNLGQAGIQVPSGYATTAQAYWNYLEAQAYQQLAEQTGREQLSVVARASATQSVITRIGVQSNAV